ncbi:hydroperoxidase II [Methyloligella halotolerans]|uniref:catalase n=1 Tax=Methyloligella halotolerans TaxID=1177755 RepID=A0A1E2RW01_9HYPH|nr:hydroperoxidase II [Methyloligella halotolerans]
MNRAAPNAASVFYDAVIVPGGKSAGSLAKSGAAINFINETFHHGKPIAALSDGKSVLEAARLPEMTKKVGVFTADDESVLPAFIDAIKQHRYHNRTVAPVAA